VCACVCVPEVFVKALNVLLKALDRNEGVFVEMAPVFKFMIMFY